MARPDAAGVSDMSSGGRAILARRGGLRGTPRGYGIVVMKYMHGSLQGAWPSQSGERLTFCLKNRRYVFSID
eukprot:COSAG01_NODE_4989_length_4568_cov_6.110141_2_plen_72_part_00